eukprot:10797606-Prorocentrum_lima.AAC.1
MTSSLVGSEMCIRDRMKLLRLARHVLGAGPGLPSTAMGCVNARELSLAVSYTHLTLPTICSV